MLKKLLMIAVLAMSAPFAANAAVTISATSNIADGDTGIDIFGGPYFFGADFSAPETAGSFTFEFTNTSATQQAVGVSIGTVLQFTAKFVGGITAAWNAGQSVVIAEGVTDNFHINTVLAPGASDILTVNYGSVVDVISGGQADIDLSIAAVPLPAGLALLGLGLAGIGGARVMQRRKSV